MKTTLDDGAADRLVKLLGMTGSVHVGERDAAVTKANAFLRELGLTWRDVIQAPRFVLREPPPPRPEAAYHDDLPDCEEMLDACFARRQRLRSATGILSNCSPSGAASRRRSR